MDDWTRAITELRAAAATVKGTLRLLAKVRTDKDLARDLRRIVTELLTAAFYLEDLQKKN